MPFDITAGGGFGDTSGMPSYNFDTMQNFSQPSGSDLGWLGGVSSLLSGVFGQGQSNNMQALAQQAISGSAPWTTSGGTQMAGDLLKQVMSGDMSTDPGFLLAQLGAARTSAQQPGGYSAQAASNAALQFQNQRIQALSGPAGVGFNPAAGYQTAMGGSQAAAGQASASQGSMGFGLGQLLPTLASIFL